MSEIQFGKHTREKKNVPDGHHPNGQEYNHDGYKNIFHPLLKQ
jgi:hypothetical protein